MVFCLAVVLWTLCSHVTAAGASEASFQAACTLTNSLRMVQKGISTGRLSLSYTNVFSSFADITRSINSFETYRNARFFHAENKTCHQISPEEAQFFPFPITTDFTIQQIGQVTICHKNDEPLPPHVCSFYENVLRVPVTHERRYINFDKKNAFYTTTTSSSHICVYFDSQYEVNTGLIESAVFSLFKDFAKLIKEIFDFTEDKIFEQPIEDDSLAVAQHVLYNAFLPNYKEINFKTGTLSDICSETFLPSDCHYLEQFSSILIDVFPSRAKRYLVELANKKNYQHILENERSLYKNSRRIAVSLSELKTYVEKLSEKEADTNLQIDKIVKNYKIVTNQSQELVHEVTRLAADVHFLEFFDEIREELSTLKREFEPFEQLRSFLKYHDLTIFNLTKIDEDLFVKINYALTAIDSYFVLTVNMPIPANIHQLNIICSPLYINDTFVKYNAPSRIFFHKDLFLPFGETVKLENFRKIENASCMEQIINFATNKGPVEKCTLHKFELHKPLLVDLKDKLVICVKEESVARFSCASNRTETHLEIGCTTFPYRSDCRFECCNNIVYNTYFQSMHYDFVAPQIHGNISFHSKIHFRPKPFVDIETKRHSHSNLSRYFLDDLHARTSYRSAPSYWFVVQVASFILFWIVVFLYCIRISKSKYDTVITRRQPSRTFHDNFKIKRNKYGIVCLYTKHDGSKVVYDPISDSFKDKYNNSYDIDIPELVNTDYLSQSFDQADISILSGNKFCMKDHPLVVYDHLQSAWYDKNDNKLVFGLDVPSEFRTSTPILQSIETSNM